MKAEIEQLTGPRLGLVVLSTDETLEDEMRAALGDRQVHLYHSRIFSAPEVTPESLRDMEARLEAAVALLPEGLDAIGYGCTSASVLIGPEAVAAQVRRQQPGAAATNPISAVLAALRALGARRIGLVTPYVAQVAAPMVDFLARHGIEVVSERGFGEGDDRRVARIAEASTRDAILEVGRAAGAEAVFASCTNLRSFGIIEDAERALGLPVISSNSALIWHLLSLGGTEPLGWGPGRLYGARPGP